MPQLKTWQFRLFYLILFLLPANLAKHFLTKSAYVSGILVDYLIPSLYLTDILIIFLLILWLIEKTRENRQIRIWNYDRIFKSPSVIFLLLLLPSVILATSFPPAIYKWFKFLELILFAAWLKKHITLNLHLSSITRWLSASVIFQSLLALSQWFKQASIFGYWFLGEQPYTTATPGIDKITWFNGSLKLPPMATFPHPNVLAGFLAITLPLILYQLFHTKPRRSSLLLYLTSISLATLSLFLTFSLSAWLALLLISLPSLLLVSPSGFLKSSLRHQQLSLVKNLPRFNLWQQALAQRQTPTKKKTLLKTITIYLGMFIIILSLSTKLSFLAPESSFTRRSQLAQIAKAMIKSRPLTGVGLNNFTPIMEQYGYVTATTRFFQPVHNIYLLLLAETGLLGLLGFGYLLISLLLKIIKSKQFAVLIPLLTLLFIGLFDHYPLTIQQGLLLFFLLLGLVS